VGRPSGGRSLWPGARAMGSLHGETVSLRLPWDVPYGSFYLLLDPLSAFFLAPIFALSALAALYGWSISAFAGEEKRSILL